MSTSKPGYFNNGSITAYQNVLLQSKGWTTFIQEIVSQVWVKVCSDSFKRILKISQEQGRVGGV